MLTRWSCVCHMKVTDCGNSYVKAWSMICNLHYYHAEKHDIHVCTKTILQYTVKSCSYILPCRRLFESYSNSLTHVFTRDLRGVHTMRFITSRCPVKPCLVKYFQWLLKVIKDKEALHCEVQGF